MSSRQMPRRNRGTNKSLTRFDPKTFLATAGIGRTLREYASKQVVFSQGEPAKVVYVQNGRVRISELSKQGREATIALLGPGDFLGEEAIASDQPIRMATATAITDCSVLKIARGGMLQTLHVEHAFSDLFAAYMLQRHARTQEDLVDQMFKSLCQSQWRLV